MDTDQQLLTSLLHDINWGPHNLASCGPKSMSCNVNVCTHTSTRTHTHTHTHNIYLPIKTLVARQLLTKGPRDAHTHTHTHTHARTTHTHSSKHPLNLTPTNIPDQLPHI